MQVNLKLFIGMGLYKWANLRLDLMELIHVDLMLGASLDENKL